MLEKKILGESIGAPVLDSHLCKLGAWIENETQSRLGLQTKFSCMVNLHRDLHTLGQKAIALQAKGDVRAALKLLPKIRQQCDLLLIELRALIS